MTRTALTDGSGKWFDEGKAIAFDESTFWNGNNNISRATKSQWEHERLYRTESGRWVINSWSQMQGTMEAYSEITDQEAAKWLMKNEYRDDDIPDDLLDLIKKDINELEL